MGAALLACKQSGDGSGRGAGAASGSSSASSSSPATRPGASDVVQGRFQAASLGDLEQRVKRAGWKLSESESSSNERTRELSLSVDEDELMASVEVIDLTPTRSRVSEQVALEVGATSFVVLELDDVADEPLSARAELERLLKVCPIDTCDGSKLGKLVEGLGWKVTDTHFSNGATSDELVASRAYIDGERKQGDAGIAIEYWDYAKVAAKGLLARDGLAFMSVDFCASCGDKLRNHRKLLQQVAK